MKLSKLAPEELELMSYTDLTYELIKENKMSMNTPTVFKEICVLLEYNDEDYVSKIGDYYTSLTIDKRFVLLANNEWDIRDNHSVKIVIDDDDEEIIDDGEEEEIIEEDEEEEVTVYDDESEINDDGDDLEDLAIITEDEELEE